MSNGKQAKNLGQHLECYAEEFEMDSVGDGNHGRLSNRRDVVTSVLSGGTPEPTPGYISGSSAEFQNCLIQKDKYKQQYNPSHS